MATNTHQQVDPGKNIGTAGFVVAFTGVHIVGLILSIIGYTKSHSAGHHNGLALAGIILNAVFMVLIVPLGLITVVSYNGITARAHTAAAATTASAIMKYAEIYNANNKTYPTESGDLLTPQATQALMPLKDSPSDPDTVELYECGGRGVAVGYWNYQKGEVHYQFAGNVASLNECTFLDE